MIRGTIDLSSVVTLGTHAFELCSSYTTLVLSTNANFKIVSASAFADNWSLQEINIPSNVTKIEDYAFLAGTNATLLTFIGNSSCTSIGEGSFMSCSSILFFVLS